MNGNCKSERMRGNRFNSDGATIQRTMYIEGVLWHSYER